MHDLFLAIQSTYHSVELGLFSQDRCLDVVTVNKLKAAESTIPVLDQLLKKHTLSFGDLICVVVNRGPAPFTTLRVVLSTVNGLSFASTIPLVGVDGLEVLTQEFCSKEYPTVALLQAFNFDVYYAVANKGIIDKKGYKNIDALLQELHTLYPDRSLYFIGNGTHLYQDKIKTVFKSYAHIPVDLPLFCSLQQVGETGWQRWQEDKDIAHKVLPLYLKE